MNTNKATSQYIDKLLKIILFALDEDKNATELQKTIVRNSLDLCYTQGVLDNLKSQWDELTGGK